MAGWIKLYRQIFDNPIVTKDPDYFIVWCWLLLNATHKERAALFGNEKIILKPGQLITGRKKIAKETHVSESKIVRILKRLKIEQQIEQQTNSRGSLISILAWNDYQKSEQQTEQQVNNKWTATEQQVNTKQECKEGKNVKNDYSSLHEEIKKKHEQAIRAIEEGVQI